MKPQGCGVKREIAPSVLEGRNLFVHQGSLVCRKLYGLRTGILPETAVELYLKLLHDLICRTHASPVLKVQAGKKLATWSPTFRREEGSTLTGIGRSTCSSGSSAMSFSSWVKTGASGLVLILAFLGALPSGRIRSVGEAGRVATTSTGPMENTGGKHSPISALGLVQGGECAYKFP